MLLPMYGSNPARINNDEVPELLALLELCRLLPLGRCPSSIGWRWGFPVVLVLIIYLISPARHGMPSLFRCELRFTRSVVSSCPLSDQESEPCIRISQLERHFLKKRSFFWLENKVFHSPAIYFLIALQRYSSL